MKPNKYGTPKQRIMKIGLALIFILMMALISGAGKKFYLSEYQEECYQYEQEKYIGNYSYQDWKDESKCIEDTSGWFRLNCLIVTKYWYFNSSKSTDKCIKYHLVRYMK